MARERPVEDERECALSGYSGESGRAWVRVVRYDRGARTRRALQELAAAWGAALASVFIPVAHFALVPAFLAYGVYGFAVRVRAAEVALAARGTCPDCGREQALDIAGPWRVPRFVSCQGCQRSLQIDARPDPLGS
jgi:hypothetical protein